MKTMFTSIQNEECCPYPTSAKTLSIYARGIIPDADTKILIFSVPQAGIAFLCAENRNGRSAHTQFLTIA